MTEQPPKGQRFSHVYIERGAPKQDSERMRRRLAQLVEDLESLSGRYSDFATEIPRRLGVDCSFGFEIFFSSCEIRDLLDTVTLAYEYLVRLETQGYASETQTWLLSVAAIFEEEHLHYRVDELGGVHFTYDAEFEHARSVTLEALRSARHRNALAAFQNAMAALGQAPPDCRTAIRRTFDAAEGLFKLMFAGSTRLTAGEAQKLEKLIQQAHSADDVARSAANKMLLSFRDWIDGAHFYRHEAGREEPVQPSLSLTVLMVSTGASFIRWLAELDPAKERSR